MVARFPPYGLNGAGRGPTTYGFQLTTFDRDMRRLCSTEPIDAQPGFVRADGEISIAAVGETAAVAAEAGTNLRSRTNAKLLDGLPNPGCDCRRMTMPNSLIQRVQFEDFDGHQFERLLFAFLLRTDNWRVLEWYGQAGNDSGRDIGGKGRGR